MKKLPVIIFTAAALAVAAGAHAAAVPQPDAKPAAQAAKAKGIWIDVRTPEEFNEGHLKGAVNIPADRIAAEIRRASPDKTFPVNLYCRSGRRAEAALQTLKKLGYTNVTNHGGYQDLLKQGLR